MTLHKNSGFGIGCPHLSLVAISFLIPFQISKGGKRGGLNPCIIGLLDCKVIKGCAHHIPEKKILIFFSDGISCQLNEAENHNFK